MPVSKNMQAELSALPILSLGALGRSITQHTKHETIGYKQKTQMFLTLY